MAFGSSLDRNTGGTKERMESPYFKLADERVIRILDREETTYWRYWLMVNVGGGKYDGRPVVVGSNDNPIRRHMDKLGKDDKGYRSPSLRRLFNVLDRTQVVRRGDTTIFPTIKDRTEVYIDPETGKILAGVGTQPNNRVYILDFTSGLMEEFNTYHLRQRNRETFELMAAWEFDFRIITTPGKSGEARDRTVKAIPDQDQNPLPAELESLPRYDLSLVTRPMPDAAQQALLDGEEYGTVIKDLGWEPIKPHWVQ